MLTGPLLRHPFRAVASVPEKAEVVNVGAPARRASRYAQGGKPQTAQQHTEQPFVFPAPDRWLGASFCDRAR
jgi:hypothetical protein